MFEIDRIPEKVREALLHMISSPVSLKLAVFCDKNIEQESAEVYLLANDTTLYSVCGRQTSDGASWEAISLDRISLDTCESFFVEEQLSTARLLAHGKDGARLVACFSNSCKDSVYVFVKYLQKLLRREDFEIDPEDRQRDKVCPKCGMYYPDPARRTCPNCMEKGKILRRMLSFFGAYRARLIWMLLSLALLTAMSIITPYFTGAFFYDDVLDAAGEFYGDILFAIGLLLATRVLNMLAGIVNNYVTSTVAAGMVFDLKKTIFSSIKRLSLGFFTGRQTGGLMTQVNDDSNTIYSFFCDILPYFVVNIAKIVVLTVLLFLIDPLLALLALVTVPLFFLLMKSAYRREKKLHAQRFTGARQLNSFLSDILSGMRIVKAFAREQDEITRFADKNEKLAGSEHSLTVYHNYVGHSAGMLLYAGNLIAFAVGGWMVMTGYVGAWSIRNTALTYGMLATFLSYMNMIYTPLHFFADMTNMTSDCVNAMQRLFEIMDAEAEIKESETALAPTDLDGSVEFRDVSFSYTKGRRIIDGVSFSVPAGKILGIVGHTGAGKSTLANLLMRLYDVQDGAIYVGGHNVKDLKFSTLYDHIAIVSQETYLFMGTILDNIRYARPDATFEEVIEASKCSGAHDFIMQLPDAYHTKIGFGYQDLSGGERQRISIARAILKNPKILILDEATAAMDTATERRIQEAISKLIEGKTTIMIAHRLSTLRDADRLIVIERGKVAEQGTHAELLEKENGIYKRLYDLQMEALKNAGIIE